MKKRLVLFLAVCLLAVCSCAWADYWDEGHQGTSADPYLIDSIDDLKALRDRVNNGEEPSNKYYKLTIDMNLTQETTWVPIGYGGNRFKGHFNGDNHTLYVNISRFGDLGYRDPDTDSWYDHRAGIFGWIESSGYGVKNLKINATNIQAAYTGGVVYGLISGSIENCHITGSVGERHYDDDALTSSSYESGGIVGYMSGGTVKKCTVNGKVTAYAQAGGIVAQMEGGSIDSCEILSNADILSGRRNGADSGVVYAGGIVGRANISLTDSVKNCKFYGKVSATARDWWNNVKTGNSNVLCGGIVGYLTGGTLQSNKVQSTATIFSDYTAGGIAGKAESGSTLEGNSVASDVNITANGNSGALGGLVGNFNVGTVKDNSSFAILSGTALHKGGVIGKLEGTTATISNNKYKGADYGIGFDTSGFPSDEGCVKADPVVKITTNSLANGVVGKAYSAALNADSDCEWSISSGTLPDGLKLNAATAKILGTPRQAGSYTFTVKAKSALGAVATKTFTIKVTQTTVSGTIPSNIICGVQYTWTPKASSGTSAYTWSVSSGKLPDGMSINSSTGVITGKPTVSGTFRFSVCASDKNGVEGSKVYTVNVTRTTVTASIPAKIIKGASYTWTPTATGGTLGYTWSVISGTLPKGMKIDASTGKITGSPSAIGTYPFTVQALDKNGVAGTIEFTVKVNQVSITASIPATIVRGASYTWTPKATNGTTPYTWSISSGKLPTGMKINASTGKITGTPTAAGTFPFTVKAVDKNKASATMAFTVNVTQTDVTASVPATIIRGASYTWTPKATGGTAPYTWSISSGKLPTGMTIDASTGKITGKPTKKERCSFKVKAVDKNKVAATMAFTVKVTQTTMTANLPEEIVRGVSYTWTPEVSDGTPNYTWSISSGKLPTGMKIDTSTGKITGKPTEAKPFTFKIKAVDKNKVAATMSFTVNVTQTTVTASVPDTIVKGVSYTWTPKATGGTVNYTWSISSGKLPTGMKINASTGKITGKPTKKDTFNFTVKAVDKNKIAGTKAFTVVVSQVELEAITSNIALKGSQYNGYVLASNGTAPYTWSISSGTLPAGLKLSSSGAKASIKGKPSETGTFTFTVKAVDNNKASATVKITVTVIDISSLAESAGKSANSVKTSLNAKPETSTSLQAVPLELMTGNTDVNIRATLSVASDDVVESYEGKDSDMVKVKADKPLTFIIGKWPEEVESVTVYIDDKAVEGVTVTEGVFTLPAELVHNDFKVSAKAGKFESEEVFIISE